MAENMIERVARAVAPDVIGVTVERLGKFPDDWNGDTIDTCVAVARAAIKAMREPTIDMTKAGKPCVRLKGMADSYCAQATYTAMITAALEEGE